MGRIITFNMTKMGASHVKSGKPCQDYSLCWQSDDGGTHVVIICDGHGGDTYVRSDRGSRLAAEITLRNIREMIACTSPALFLDKEGAVTARPEDEEDNLFHMPHPKNEGDLGDSERQQLEQDRAFYAAVAPIREQDQHFNRLFASIYLQWVKAIEQDAEESQFNEYEKSCLKNARITKAYGTTLMAFVRTPLYWFAFHIGDGKMLCCDINFNWREPVPWDCNCFLNITTSLCEHNPLHSFRYAFSGKGDFPVAVMMGSDGIDDSWHTMERLQNFYSQTLGIFNDLGEEEAIRQLGDYLSILSEKGSRDDVSMAGIIDMDAIRTGVEIYKRQRILNTLRKEKEEWEAELKKMESTQAEVEKEITHLSESCQEYNKKHTEWLRIIDLQKKERKEQIEKTAGQLAEKEQTRKALEQDLQSKSEAYRQWAADAIEQKSQLESEYHRLISTGTSTAQQEAARWLALKESFKQAEEEKKIKELSVKAAYMAECSPEAMKQMTEGEHEAE